MPEDYQQYDTRQKREFWKNHVARWQQSGLSPFDGDLFVSCNRQRNMIKILY